MNRSILLVIASLIFSLSLAQPPSKADEAAVRALPVKTAEVFPDPEAITKLLTEDAHYIIGDGTHLRGRAEIIAYFNKLLQGQDAFGTSLKGVTATADITDLRFLSKDVAVLQTHGGLLMPGETSVPPERRGIQSWVAVKKDGKWLIALYHNTRIMPQR